MRRDINQYRHDIIDLYRDGNSTYKIANKYCTHAQTIRQILIRNNIKLRSIAETNHMRFANHTRLDDKTLDIITGWMLGDGHIHFTGKQAYFNLTSKHKTYIDYAYKIITDNNLTCRINEVFDKKYKTYAYKLFTSSTIQFAELHKMWYVDRKKIVPDGIKLTSAAIKHWIMDDGTTDKRKGHLRLCTCSFTISECESLSSKLNSYLDINNASWVIEKKKYPRIYIPRKFALQLFDKIGECEVNCFQYKWLKKLNNVEVLSA